MDNVEHAWLDLNADEWPGDVALPVEVRVKQGMALLDEKHGPDWVERIDLDALRLDSTCSCVLGQLYATDEPTIESGFTRGIEALDLHGLIGDYGFDIYSVARRGNRKPSGWNDLTTAWKHAILARRLEQDPQ